MPKNSFYDRFGDLGFVVEAVFNYKRQLGVALTALVATSIMTISIPQEFKQIIDIAFSPTAPRTPIAELYKVLFSISVLAIATGLRYYYVSWLGERVIADIRTRVQGKLLSLEPRFFDDNRPSEIASRLTVDTLAIDDVIGTTVSIALRNLLIALGGTAYLFVISPRLAIMAVMIIPLMVLPLAIFGKAVRRQSEELQDRIAAISSMTVETLKSMSVVQAYGQEWRESDQFSKKVEQTFAFAKRRTANQSLMIAVTTMFILGAATVILWQGTDDVISGRISRGGIAAFVLTGGVVAGALGALTEVYGDLARGAGAAGRIKELLNIQPQIASPVHPIRFDSRLASRLKFDSVSFSYPGSPNLTVIDNLSLTVEPGQTVAIVGRSGAGKSTLFELVERFYDPKAGRVLLNGVDLRDADLDSVRANFSLVPQGAKLFSGSVRDNLRYGRWTATDKDIWDAAEVANAAKFLKAFPLGLDTLLGDDGARLSGGQRQRLAIARAVLRDAPILLLDEATSSLDTESERLVQQALSHLMKGRTTLVIAHRLATIRNADNIAVLEAGRIISQGTHSSLMAEGGVYSRFAAAQFGALT
jgi:ATP-binding cassette subfamily B protein